MFGMIILNHMEMNGENICVKLKLFEKKIEEMEKIRFTIYDDLTPLEAIEKDGVCGEDEYSSPFIVFDKLEKGKKYRVFVECCANGVWGECCNCYTTTATQNFKSDDAIYSVVEDKGLPVYNSDFKVSLPIVFKEVVK